MCLGRGSTKPLVAFTLQIRCDLLAWVDTLASGNLARSPVSFTDMPRLRHLFWLVWVWCFVSSAQAATLTIESTNAQGAIELSDREGNPCPLKSVDAKSVIDGPWVVTELEVACQHADAPNTLRIALPPHAFPLERAYAPKLVRRDGNVWEVELDEYASRIQIAYVQEIAEPRVVLVPLAGHAALDHLAVRVTNQAGQPLAEPLEVAGTEVKGDIVLWTTPSTNPVRSKQFAAIPVRIPGKFLSDPLTNPLFLIDTSASSHRSYEQLIELTRELLAHCSGQVAVVAFDQEVESVYQGAVSAITPSTFDRLVRRGALGATDLAGALRSASKMLRAGTFRRVVLMSDGMGTLDRNGSQKLKELVASWSRLGVRRLDAVLLSASYDDSLLHDLTSATLPERGVVIAVTDSFNPLIRLETKTTADLSVSVEGAIAQTPRVLRGFEPGDLVWVYAQIPADRPLGIHLAGVPLSVPAPITAYFPLLERVSTHLGVGATPQSTDAPEQLEIRDGKLELITVRTRPPICRCGISYVSGRLPPEAIQRVVRLNHGRFRDCYHRALLSQPKLTGRVAVRFVIGPVGHVTSVHDDGSTLASPAATRCILEAFSKLEFPMPEGGDVTVVYPLRLTPDGSVDDDASKGTAPALAERVELVDPKYPLRPREVGEEAYLGGFADVMKALRERRWHDAETSLHPFERQSRQDLVSILARAQYAEQLGELPVARRAYGSLLDLYPRSDPIRRLVAAHWARLGDAAANSLARSSLETSNQRDVACDMTQRQLAWAWVKDGDHRRGLELLVRTLLRCSKAPEDGLPDLLRRDVAMIARAAIAATPAKQSEIFDLLRTVGVQPTNETAVRFLVHAEHGDGLSLGLYPDPSSGRVRGIDQWFGPHQAFTIPEKDRLAPYTIHVRHLTDLYASPQAISFGYVEIVEQNARGRLRVEHRPFLFQTSRSEIDLGRYGVSTGGTTW